MSTPFKTKPALLLLIIHIAGAFRSAEFVTNASAGQNRAKILRHFERKDSTTSRLDEDQIRARYKRWIIIVDDEEAIRSSVGDFLYDCGFQITACADAEAIWNVLEENQPYRSPDAIVSDIRMPGDDGIALLKRLRADERLARVPVIMLTAKGLTEDRVRGYRAGAWGYLTKPFQLDELLAMLDNAILRRQQMATNSLGELRQEIASIKKMMEANSARVVKQTDVFLSASQRQLLELLCEGKTNSEIAALLGRKDVSDDLQKLYRLTKVKTRTALVRWAFETGYACPID